MGCGLVPHGAGFWCRSRVSGGVIPSLPVVRGRSAVHVVGEVVIYALYTVQPFSASCTVNLDDACSRKNLNEA